MRGLVNPPSRMSDIGETESISLLFLSTNRRQENGRYELDKLSGSLSPSYLLKRVAGSRRSRRWRRRGGSSGIESTGTILGGHTAPWATGAQLSIVPNQQPRWFDFRGALQEC